VRLAIGLFLGPAGAGDQQQISVGADGLRVGGGLAHTHHCGALATLREGNRDGLDSGGAGLTLPGGLAAGIDQD
jgi:hypothetical protein